LTSYSVSRTINDELALRNLLGGILFNLCITLAMVALITLLAVSRNSRVKDLPMHFIAALMVAVCGNQLYLDHINYHQIMLSHGITLLSFFGIYLYYTALEVADNFPHKKSLHQSHHELVEQENGLSVTKACALMTLGLIGLVIGGELIVE
jgi:cation:H+ antiporter